MTSRKRTKSRALVRRKANPMTSRVPKPPRNKFTFDGSMLHATIFAPAAVTAANISTDFQQIGTDQNVAPSRVMLAMVRQYREYRYTKVTVQWIPIIGPSSVDAGSRVHFAYTDNPEQGSNFQLGIAPFNTAANRVAFVKGARNCFTFNAWERITWNVPLTRRHPWFDVNTADPASDINMFDRAVQGMVVQAYESVSAAVNLGISKITFEIELRGLDVDATAIV